MNIASFGMPQAYVNPANYGGASGAEVLALAKAIQQDVAQRFGVELEAEPVCL